MTIKQKYIKELIYRSMAYFHNEDSSDGTLIIDEQNEDFETIELSDDSDTEKLDNINFNNDVEVISSSSSKCSSFDDESSHTCSFCSKLFYDKISLYDHISTYQGSCSTNMLSINERNIEVDSELDYTYERKQLEKYTLDKVPVPEAIPLSPKLSSVSCVSNTINKSIPSLRQMLVDEIEPEHPCLICGQIFRHNIGLICHINSDHKEVHNEKKNSIIETTNKSGRKKRISKDIKVKKIVEDLEPLSNKVDLTLLPDLKKDTLLNRIKSYVHIVSKGHITKVICILCNIDFKTTKKAMAHVEDKHILDKIECGYCNMKFVYELKLRSHMAKRHKVIAVHKCSKCLKMINKDECDAHFKKCNGGSCIIRIKKESSRDVMVKNLVK